MRRFWQNSETKQEKNGELMKSLAELDCEEAIIKDKQEFGRARNSMMKVLRAKHGKDLANRTLNRINKRMQKKYFDEPSTL